MMMEVISETANVQFLFCSEILEKRGKNIYKNEAFTWQFSHLIDLLLKWHYDENYRTSGMQFTLQISLFISKIFSTCTIP